MITQAKEFRQADFRTHRGRYALVLLGVVPLVVCAAAIAAISTRQSLGDWGLPYNTLVVLTGTSLLGACAGMVGTFTVLRGRALVGDALAHAALPGVCAAFLVLGQKSLPVMLAGALASGVLGVGIIAVLRRYTRIKEDAAIGIVLSVFFGAGISLSRLIQNQATGSQAGLDSYILGKTAGMLAEDVYFIAGVAVLSVATVLLLYKEFKLVAFDVAFARVQGWPTTALDFVLMSLVAVAVVIGLPAVGAILMAALLIIPAAAARFWSDRLGWNLVVSAIFGATIGATGTALSAQFTRSPTGPIIVLLGAAIFLVSMLFAPGRGVIARAIQQRRTLVAPPLLEAVGGPELPDHPTRGQS